MCLSSSTVSAGNQELSVLAGKFMITLVNLANVLQLEAESLKLNNIVQVGKFEEES